MEKNFVHFIFGFLDLRLPRPELGNSKRLEFTRINRRSRGGDLVVYRDPNWPRNKTLALTFSWLSLQQQADLLNFLSVSLGANVQYVDHYGKTWIGVIMTPSAQITQESLNNASVSLEFQGIEQ